MRSRFGRGSVAVFTAPPRPRAWGALPSEGVPCGKAVQRRRLGAETPSGGRGGGPPPAPMWTHWGGWLMTLSGVGSRPSPPSSGWPARQDRPAGRGPWTLAPPRRLPGDDPYPSSPAALGQAPARWPGCRSLCSRLGRATSRPHPAPSPDLDKGSPAASLLAAAESGNDRRFPSLGVKEMPSYG